MTTSAFNPATAAIASLLQTAAQIQARTQEIQRSFADPLTSGSRFQDLLQPKLVELGRLAESCGRWCEQIQKLASDRPSDIPAFAQSVSDQLLHEEAELTLILDALRARPRPSP